VGAFINEVEGGVPSAPHSILIKKLHILSQTPTYQCSVNEKEEIDLLIKILLEMKLRGEISGKPCNLGTCWTFNKKEIGKHRIGNMVGGRNSFNKFPEIICTGNTPSLSKVITAIKQTNGTKIGKEVSIIEVPVDVLEYCGYVPIAQNAKAFSTSCFETVFGLKNKNGKLEMYHCGKKTSTGGKRKYIAFPKRMFVDGPPGERGTMSLGRFGLLRFSANRNQLDWEICKCNHINGDPTDDRNENVRWLTRKDNKTNNNNRTRRSHATWASPRFAFKIHQRLGYVVMNYLCQVSSLRVK
jgi:hypothetical protein